MANGSLIAAGLERAGSALIGAAERLRLGTRFKAHRAWVAANGDRTFRLDYPLNEASVVWDVGGFEGQWSSDVHARFRCRCDLFEPEPSAAKALGKRFALNERMVVHPFALGASDGKANLSGSGDAVRVDGRGQAQPDLVDVKDIVAFWRDGGSPFIDLMKLNVEGAEYPLIERMAEGGMLRSVGNLQVQFHDFVEQATQRRAQCLKLLEGTHTRVWNFEFVWESWTLRKVP